MLRKTGFAAVLATLVLAAPASAQDSYQLGVSKDPSVGGTVTGTESGRFPAGSEIIDCGSDCSETVSEYETCIHKPTGPICSLHWPQVEIVASPFTGWQFNGWEGSGCTGQPATCSVAGSTSNKSPEATFVDVQSPSVAITSPPTDGSPQRGTVTVTATASDNHGVQRVEFRHGGTLLGSDTSAPYSGTFPTTGLPQGSEQRITARAFDLSGRSSDVNRTVEVDNMAVGSFVAPTPAQLGFTNSATPQIEFTKEEDVNFSQCRVVDDGASTFCESPWTSPTLDEGVHTVELQLVDDLNNIDEYERTFTVDLTGPEVTISGSDGTAFAPGARPPYTFSADDELDPDPPALECRLDEAAFAPCGSPYTAPETDPGTHTLSVKATDQAGNETISGRTFVIDATPPETRITSGPADGATTGSTVTFGFAAEPGATYRCRVYQAALTPLGFGECSDATSHTAPGFSPGTYRFEVVATDEFGNEDPSPARRTFTVPGAPPVLSPGPSGSPSPVGGGTPAPGGGTPSPIVSTAGSLLTFDRVKLTHLWSVRRRGARVLKLTLRKLPKGAKVRVKCKGRGCPFKRKTRTAKRSKLVLKKFFKKRRLRPGARIEIRVTKDGYTGKVYRYKVRKGRRLPKSTVRCLEPGARKPTRCE